MSSLEALAANLMAAKETAAGILSGTIKAVSAHVATKKRLSRLQAYLSAPDRAIAVTKHWGLSHSYGSSAGSTL
jgi:hypothetical protein